jgi:hypothetical protein
MNVGTFDKKIDGFHTRLVMHGISLARTAARGAAVAGFSFRLQRLHPSGSCNKKEMRNSLYILNQSLYKSPTIKKTTVFVKNILK